MVAPAGVRRRVAVDGGGSQLGGTPSLPLIEVVCDLSGDWDDRGYRFGVEQPLELLAVGKTIEQIKVDFTFIETEDLREALGYAAAIAKRNFYLAAHA